MQQASMAGLFWGTANHSRHIIGSSSREVERLGQRTSEDEIMTLGPLELGHCPEATGLILNYNMASVRGILNQISAAKLLSMGFDFCHVRKAFVGT